MKRGNMFWGLFFVSIGIIFIIQTVFKIDLPIMKILFGLFLIYMGLKVLFGSFGVSLNGFQINRTSNDNESIFTNTNFNLRKSDGSLNKKFTTAFGSSELDLTSMTNEELAYEIKLENGFGKTVVKTKTEIPIKADISMGFSSVIIRGQKAGSFGEVEFQTPGWQAQQPYYRIKVESGFGEVIIN